MKRKHNKRRDPFAERETKKYSYPIASRELILQVLNENDGPMTLESLHKKLNIKSSRDVDAFAHRLAAMERDGQIFRNRNNNYLPVSKADLVSGKVIGYAEGFGFLKPDSGGDDYYLSPFQMRSLLHGDRVIARPLENKQKGRQEAVIVEIIERHNQEVVGRYFEEHGIGFVVPDNKQLHQEIIIPTDFRNPARHGQYVVATITDQPTRHRQPIGKIVSVLGDHMAPGMEIEVAIRAHELPYTWSEDTLNEISSLSYQTIASETAQRIDLRNLHFVTIDGADAKDFDDAVYCEPNTQGWCLWVAIADVSFYVKPDTALDRDARMRGTSVYFPEYVIPMLPERLSNDLCSLNPNVDRLCMVCEMQITKAGVLKNYKFYEAVIRSAARLTYDEVFQIIVKKNPDGRAKRKELNLHLDNLHGLYKELRKNREQRGAIDFESNETRIQFDENRKIARILPLHRNEAHKLIEECMIAANISAAKFLHKKERETLYRVHEGPTEEKLSDLRLFLSSLGLKLSGGDEPQPAHYAHLIQQIAKRADRHVVETVMLRSLARAVYSRSNIGHFGLSLQHYTHFTSPIRRYPDLTIHRIIRSLVSKNSRQKYIPSLRELEKLGEHCSIMERRADEATRDVIDWLKCAYMLDKVGETYSGIVSSVTSFGFFVELEDFYIEGLVHVTSLTNDYYHFDAGRQRLVGERSKITYQLGQQLKVIVSQVNLEERKIDFALAEEKKFTVNKKKKRSRRSRKYH